MMCWHMSPSAIPRKKFNCILIQKTSRFLSETRVCWFCFVWNWLWHTSRRQTKVFWSNNFFKNVGEVWASSPRLRSKSNCIMKWNKNLRTNRKNRNCLQIKKVVMKDKVSGAIAIPKASWGCAPALPNRIRVVFLEAKFPIMSRRQLKVFWSNNFSKMLARCGRAAHICGANNRTAQWNKTKI